MQHSVLQDSLRASASFLFHPARSDLPTDGVHTFPAHRPLHTRPLFYPTSRPDFPIQCSSPSSTYPSGSSASFVSTSSLMRPQTGTPSIPCSLNSLVRLGSPLSSVGSMNIFSSTTHAHSTTVPSRAWTRLIAELSVPPVATRSSMTRTRSPFLILSFWTVSPALFPYSVLYAEELIVFGIFPSFRIMMNGFFRARAMGGPSMNPLASSPATESMPISA
mmetsp:Transcript_38764/g.92766  ORF Transcript_38764/g.92766 Transcript_38764/m.92766 type:complete len:219 (-) Transcript_38764:381-1037(-)